MGIANDYILGNETLHDCFLVMTEILGALVSSTPDPLSLAQLANGIGRPAKELAKSCAALARAQLLRQDQRIDGGWALACEPASITLEDVFFCVVAQQAGKTRPIEAPTGEAARIRHDVDLLIMQATMAINQSVFKHLRQFSLDRLKFSSPGVYTSTVAVNAEQYHAPGEVNQGG